MKRSLIVLGLLILFGASAVYGYNRRSPNPDPNHTHADFAVWINGVQLDFSQEKFMSHVPVAVDTSTSSFTIIPEASAHDDEPEGGSGSVAITGREYLHLHDMNGHVIHRHKPGLTFGDFLASLGFVFSEKVAGSSNVQCLTTPDGKEYCNDADPIEGFHWWVFVNGKPLGCSFDSKYGVLCNDVRDPSLNTHHTLKDAWNYDFADGDQILLTYIAAQSEAYDQIDTLTDDACTFSKTCPGRGTPPTENCIADPTIPCTVQ